MIHTVSYMRKRDLCPGPWHEAVHQSFLKSRNMHAVAKTYNLTTAQVRGIVYWCRGDLTAKQILKMWLDRI